MKWRRGLVLLFVVAMLGGCDQPVVDPSLPEVVVHKHGSCKCCRLWAQQMRNAGFGLKSKNTMDLTPIRERVGVPPHLESCHTSEVGGYFIEGHVPIAEVKRLLRERPAGRGLVVPGMPTGSPGMEVTSGRVVPYDVLFVNQDGSVRAIARYGQ